MEKEFMQEAVMASKINEINNFQDGGPFGAVIVKNGEIIAKCCNTVLKSNDPTAHAEINVIRKSGEILNTHDLSGCEIYTSCFPCPMCAAAIIWANIDKVYYANTSLDASEIGFRDDDIYQLFKDIKATKPNSKLQLISLDKKEAIKVFEKFKNNNKDHLY